MLEFGDKFYYIDILAMDKAISPKEPSGSDVTETESIEYNSSGGTVTRVVTTVKTPKTKDFDPVKYDTIKTMIEIITYESPHGDEDDKDDLSLGTDAVLDSKGLPFKIAFNTLKKLNILKEI